MVDGEWSLKKSMVYLILIFLLYDFIYSDFSFKEQYFLWGGFMQYETIESKKMKIDYLKFVVKFLMLTVGGMLTISSVYF